MNTIETRAEQAAREDREQTKAIGRTLCISVLPIVGVGFVFGFFAWLSARLGAGYSIVKAFAVFPGWIYSNILGLICSIPLIMLGAIANRSITFGTLGDLSMITSFFGPFVLFVFTGKYEGFQLAEYGTSIMFILAYQIFWYTIFGLGFTRHVALSFFDAELYRNAVANGVTTLDARMGVITSDDMYKNDTVYYAERNKAPFLGSVLMIIAGRNPSKFY